MAAIIVMTTIFNQILCLYILPVIYGVLKSTHFSCANSQIHYGNQIQSMIIYCPWFYIYPLILYCQPRVCTSPSSLGGGEGVKISEKSLLGGSEVFILGGGGGGGGVFGGGGVT